MISIVHSPQVILGVKAQLVLSVTDYLTTDDGFIINLLNGQSVNEYGVISTPSVSNFLFQDNSDSAYTFLDDYLIDRVIPKLAASMPNYAITMELVAADQAFIYITALLEGPEFDIFLEETYSPIVTQETAINGVLGSNIVMARTPVEFLTQTDNYQTAAGSKAHLDLIFTGLATNGNTFTLTFLGLTQTFSFTSFTPDDSGLQIPIDGLNTADFVENFVIPALKQNFYISQDYEVILQTSTSARIRALKVGTLYNITGTEAVANMTMSAPTAGTDATFRTGFRILADLFAESSYLAADYKPVFGAEAIPNAANQCLFDFTDILTGLPLKPDAPAFNSASFFVLNQCYRRFYVRFAEYYSNTPRVSKQLPAEPAHYLAIHGARAFLNLGQNINADFCAPGKFLTLMPADVTCAVAQHQYLSFFVQTPPAVSLTLRLMYRLNYTDGSNGSWTSHSSITGQYAKQIVTIKAGFNQLNLSAAIASGKEVKSYQIKVDNGTTDLTETRTFTLIKERYQNRYFLFFNSFGLPETVFFHGMQSRDAKFMRQQIRLAKPTYNATTGVHTGDETHIYPEFKRGFELATGYKRKNYLDYFLDFMNSPAHYEQQADKYAGISISKQDIELDDDKQRLYGLNLKYNTAYTERGNA